MRLILGPRPGKKSIETIRGQCVTHLVTLLAEREDAAASGRIAAKIGAKWIHIPMNGGHMDKLAQMDLAVAFSVLSEAGALDDDAIVYLHCSAGIHRTGFFAYALLRWRGASADEAKSALETIRPVTAKQVGEDRLALADKMLAERKS